LGVRQAVRCSCTPGCPGFPTRAAPLLRHASRGEGSRRQGRPGSPRARPVVDDTGVYAGDETEAKRRLRRSSSASTPRKEEFIGSGRTPTVDGATISELRSRLDAERSTLISQLTEMGVD